MSFSRKNRTVKNRKNVANKKRGGRGKTIRGGWIATQQKSKSKPKSRSKSKMV